MNEMMRFSTAIVSNLAKLPSSANVSVAKRMMVSSAAVTVVASSHLIVNGGARGSIGSSNNANANTPFLNRNNNNMIINKCQTQRRYMGNWPKVRPKRIRMITFDVTGTIVSFRGTLEEHYLGAAAKYGVTDVDAYDFAKSFNKAYKETSFLQPCFGGQDISAKQWWRECVTKSFQYAGADMDDKTAELVFQRIYSTFGSIQAYEIFPDALPFLHWARRHGKWLITFVQWRITI
jgi:hypothetical protein